MIDFQQPLSKVNISNFAFGEWVLLLSGIRRAVAVTTLMALKLFFLEL